MKNDALIRAGKDLIQYRDLLGFRPGKQTVLLKREYGNRHNLELFTSRNEIELGFTAYENKLYNKHITRKGNILVVGCSGGREAQVFAKAGHTVTAIDICKGMIERARYWARKYNLNIDYKVKDVCGYVPRKDSLNYITFTVYFLIIGKEKRISILRNLNKALMKRGLIFVIYRHPVISEHLLHDRQLLRRLAEENKYFEKNDFSFGGKMFGHQFSRKELRSEAQAAGFEVVDWSLGKPQWSRRKYGMAVLRKITPIN
jgi:SAM-dependent methyltransferase